MVFKKATEVLKNTARQLRVIFFFKQLVKARHAQNDGNPFVCTPGEICGESVVLEIIRDEHGHTTRAENVCACEEIAPVNFGAARQQISHGQFHECKDGLVSDRGIFFELRQGAFQHVDVDVGDG